MESIIQLIFKEKSKVNFFIQLKILIDKFLAQLLPIPMDVPAECFSRGGKLICVSINIVKFEKSLRSSE